jgi:hypothetical protein
VLRFSGEAFDALEESPKVTVVEDDANDWLLRESSVFLEGESSIELSVRERASILPALPGEDGEPRLAIERLKVFELGDIASKIADRSFGRLGVVGRSRCASLMLVEELASRERGDG